MIGLRVYMRTFVYDLLQDPLLQPIMDLMIAKWGGGDAEEGDPSGCEGHDDSGDVPLADAEDNEPAVEHAGDPYMLPDGQLFEPFSEDECEAQEMPVLGDLVPCPDNQGHEMPVLGDLMPTPDNQDHEMPVLGDHVMPSPDNQAHEMPVLGDHGLPTQEPAEMPVLGDQVLTPKVTPVNDLTMVATPCVNGKPPPMIERRSHITSSAGGSSESSASPSLLTSEAPRRSTLCPAARQAKLARMAELKNLI